MSRPPISDIHLEFPLYIYWKLKYTILIRMQKTRKLHAQQVLVAEEIV